LEAVLGLNLVRIDPEYLDVGYSAVVVGVRSANGISNYLQFEAAKFN